MKRHLLMTLAFAWVAGGCVSSNEPAQPRGDWVEEHANEPAVEHTEAGGIILPAGTFDFMPPDKRVWLHTQAEAKAPSGRVGIRILHDELMDDYWPLMLETAPFGERDRAAAEHRDQWTYPASNDLYAGLGAPFTDGPYIHMFQCTGGQNDGTIWELDDLVVQCQTTGGLYMYFRPTQDSNARGDEPAISQHYLDWFRHVRRATRAYPHEPEHLVPITIYTLIRDHDTAYFSKAGLITVSMRDEDSERPPKWEIWSRCLPEFCNPREE